MPTGGQSPSLQAAIQVALQYLGLSGKKVKRITDEKVDAVRMDGTAIVGGDALGTSGVFKGMRAGDHVKVGWSRTSNAVKKPKRNVILAHQVRRNIPPPTFKKKGGTLVEELFIANDPKTGAVEVWFRDKNQTVNLGLRKSLDGSDPCDVQWGTREDSFFVRTFKVGLEGAIIPGHTYYIYTIINRTGLDKPLTGAPIVTLERTEQPLTKGIALCQVNLLGSWTINMHAVTINTPTAQPGEGYLYPTLSYNVTSGIVGDALVGPVTLTKELIEGYLVQSSHGMLPLPPPGFITGAYLDDNLDLILSLYVNLDFAYDMEPSQSAWGLTRTASGSDPIEGWTWDDPNGAYISSTQPPYGGAPTIGYHGFVVNTTRKEVLHRTCMATIVGAASYVISRLFYVHGDGDHAGTIITPGGYNGIMITSVPDNAPGVEVGGGPSINLGDSFSLFAYSKSSIDPLCLNLFGEDLRHRVQGASRSTSRYIVTPYYGSNYPSTPIWHSLGHIEQSESDVTYAGWEPDFYDLYIPRRKPTTPPNEKLPKGRVLLGCNKVMTNGTNYEQAALFLIDAESNQAVTLAPFSGVTSKWTFYFNFTYAMNPDYIGGGPTGPFVILGTTKNHVLYMSSSGDPTYTITISLQELDGSPPITVMTGSGNAANHGYFPDTRGFDDSIMAFLNHQLFLLRPDLCYSGHLPTDPDIATSDKAIAERFLDAWNFDSGTPLLMEPISPTLFSPIPGVISKLAELPDGVTPNMALALSLDTLPLIGRGVINRDWQCGGPSFHVLNAQATLQTFGRFQKDS